MNLQCDKAIQAWMKAGNFNIKSKETAFSKGDFFRLVDVSQLPCSTTSHTPLARYPISNSQFGLEFMSNPTKHSPNHFCYLVHVVDQDLSIPAPRTDGDQILNEKQLRTQNALLYHPEYSMECVSLNMRLVDEKSEKSLNGTVGYIYAPVDMKRIALANNHKIHNMSWDEEGIKSTIANLKKKSAKAVDVTEKILKNKSEVIVWSGQSKVGSKIKTNDLMPIATFSICNSAGQPVSPDLSRWMKLHSQDFKIPHVDLPQSLMSDTAVAKNLSHIKINADEKYRNSLVHKNAIMTDQNILMRRLN